MPLTRERDPDAGPHGNVPKGGTSLLAESGADPVPIISQRVMSRPTIDVISNLMNDGFNDRRGKT